MAKPTAAERRRQAREEMRERAHQAAVEVKVARFQRAIERAKGFEKRSEASRRGWLFRHLSEARRNAGPHPSFTAAHPIARDSLRLNMSEEAPEWRRFYDQASKYTSDRALLKNFWMSPKIAKK